MKSPSFPSLRIDPDIRQAADESLSAFAEHAVREQIALRQSQEAFVARGLASRDQAQASATYISSAAVIKALEGKLAEAKRRA